MSRGPRDEKEDDVAGLTVAISSVPDGMASGLLAGVNPIYGVYASMIGPIVGGLLASASLMVITNRSATALVAGQALVGVSGEDRDRALFLLVILSGAFQILFGMLRLGRLTRFVSHSVMTGFLTGIAVILILSRLPTITGDEARGPNRIAQTADLLLHHDRVDLPSVGIAALTPAVAVALLLTPIRRFASLAAIVVPTLAVAILGLEGAQLVADVGEIPGGLPSPFLPALPDFSLQVLTGALSLARVVLVQGAGVAQSVPNPDGSRSDDSRDFVAQGAANVAAGFLRGVPVGGSLGATALNIVSGAGRRWASIIAGLWLLATLVLPIQGAVGLGVLLAALLYVVDASTDAVVMALVERPDGPTEEREPPERRPGGAVTVLDIYGQVFFAGARTLAGRLPRPGPDRRPVVILSLRGYPSIGATMVDVLSNYADELRRVDGRLYLTGISGDTLDRLAATGRFERSGPIRLYEATRIVWESLRKARHDAEDGLSGEEGDDRAGR